MEMKAMFARKGMCLMAGNSQEKMCSFHPKKGQKLIALALSAAITNAISERQVKT
jgi:hypothetical protein